MSQSLKLDVNIRDLLRDWSQEQNFNFSYNRSKEKHAIILDLITMTANGSVARAMNYFDLTYKFVRFISGNSKYLDVSLAYEIVNKLWQYCYLKALYSLQSKLDVQKMYHQQPIVRLIIDIYTNIKNQDEEMKKLANIHLLIVENHRLDKEIAKYTEAVKEKKVQAS